MAMGIMEENATYMIWKSHKSVLQSELYIPAIRLRLLLFTVITIQVVNHFGAHFGSSDFYDLRCETLKETIRTFTLVNDQGRSS